MQPRTVRSVVQLAAVLAASGVAVFAGTASPELARMNPAQRVKVIVRYNNSNPGSALFGGTKIGDRVEVVETTAGAASALAAHTAVAHVAPDYPVQGTGTASCSTPPCYDYTPETLQPSQPLQLYFASANGA